MRPLHIEYDHQSKLLFSTTNRGTVLKFNEDLDLLQTSLPIYNLNHLYAIASDEKFIYARDINGKLARWHKDNLELDRIIDLYAWNQAEEAEVPNVSHGLFLKNGVVYVSMPQGRIGKFSQQDLEFLGLSEYLPKSLFEDVELSSPHGHFAVDFSGYLYQGDIDEDMRAISRVANGACHQMVYDQRFDRFWITDDYHCGMALFKASHPEKFQRLPLTVDDVESMSFNSDQSELMVACFDRYIYRIKNELNPHVIDRIGPFDYQLTHVRWVGEQQAYALTESGEIYRFNPNSHEKKSAGTKTNAVWDIQTSLYDPNQFLVAF
ncbi:hypothetical protein GW916_02400, partial [bacterium]|nr:hypothetical protein [bacterium]